MIIYSFIFYWASISCQAKASTWVRKMRGSSVGPGRSSLSSGGKECPHRNTGGQNIHSRDWHMSRTLVSPRSGVLLQVTVPENRKHYCHTLRKEADKERPGSWVIGHEVCDWEWAFHLLNPSLSFLAYSLVLWTGQGITCCVSSKREGWWPGSRGQVAPSVSHCNKHYSPDGWRSRDCLLLLLWREGVRMRCGWVPKRSSHGWLSSYTVLAWQRGTSYIFLIL